METSSDALQTQEETTASFMNLQGSTEGGFAPTQRALPATRRITSVFPPYLCGAIRKQGDRADITINFPSKLSETSLNCVMSLYISASKVQYIVMALFGQNLETIGTSRYIMHGNGARSRPDSVLMGGAKKEAIDQLLGPRIGRAIEKCPWRQEEIRLAVFDTDCVSVRLVSDSAEDVLMSITMDLNQGFVLSEALFD
jgi:hypothetical protein